MSRRKIGSYSAVTTRTFSLLIFKPSDRSRQFSVVKTIVLGLNRFTIGLFYSNIDVCGGAGLLLDLAEAKLIWRKILGDTQIRVHAT